MWLHLRPFMAICSEQTKSLIRQCTQTAAVKYLLSDKRCVIAGYMTSRIIFYLIGCFNRCLSNILNNILDFPFIPALSFFFSLSFQAFFFVPVSTQTTSSPRMQQNKTKTCIDKRVYLLQIIHKTIYTDRWDRSNPTLVSGLILT